MAEEFEAGRYSIPAPRPEEDAAAAYSDIVDRRAVADQDAWMNSILSGEGGNDPAAASPASEAPDPADPINELMVPADAPAGGGGPTDIGTIRPPEAAGQGGGNQQPAELPASASSDTGWSRAIANAVRAIGGDVVGGLAEAPKQAIGGVIDAIGEVDQFMQELLPIGGAALFDEEGNFSPRLVSNEEMVSAEQTGEDLFSMLAPEDADTLTGSFVRATSQFLTGFIPGMAVLRGAGVANAGIQALSAGAIADAVVFDPHEDRLSTYLNEIPALDAVVPDYLADNNPENESAWEGRLKNAIEGAGLGVASEGLLRAFKYYKAARKAKADAKIVDPIGAQAEAAKDTLKEAARAELVEDVSDDQLRGLGDVNGSFLVEGAEGETAAVAFGRLADARVRAERSALETDALAKINAARERFAAKNGVEGRDPMDDMLDALRSGQGVMNQAGPKRPVARALEELGGVDPRSRVAAELRSRGITPKAFPGLFRKTGLKGLDNIPVDEQPIFSSRGLDDGNGYVPEQSWIDALESELRGDPWRLPEDQARFEDIISPLEELDAELSRVGIDIDQMDNASIKRRFDEIREEADRLAAMDEVPPNLGDELPEALEEGEVIVSENPPAPLDLEKVEGGQAQPKGKIFINYQRIKSADDVKAVLQQMADMDADAINAKRRGRVSNQQTIRESSREYQDLNDLLGRAPGPMNAAQAVAARRLLTSSGEQIVELARKAQSADATKADLYNFRRAMAVHYAIQSEVIAARTETARALQAWAIPAGATKARADAINELIMSSGGAGDLQGLAKAVATVGDNPTAINTMAHELGRGKFGKALYQVWINGLLSSPKTHAVNILSNSMVSLWAIPERYMSAAISKAFYNGEVETGEAAAQIYGLVKGIRDGLHLAYKGNQAEGIGELADIFDAFVKADVDYGNDISAEAFGLRPEGGFGYGIDMLGKIVNVPGSMLQAEDRFFKTIGYRMELQALAYRQAASEGLEGKEFAARVTDILANPPENLKAEALDTAHYQTFTNPLGKMGRSIQQTVNRIPGGRVVVPFIRTPTNIMKYTFERTPLAYMSGRIRADIKAGGARAAQAHARVALGSMTMLAVMDMAAEGTITGRGPLEPELRRTKMDSGWMPYSVKIGDRWYQYSRTDPIGMILGLGADIAEIMSNANGEDADMIAMAGVVALANNLASKTYMSGLYDFIGAINPNDPTSDPAKYLMDLAGSLTPYSSFLRNVTQANDPMLREYRTTVYDGETGKPDPIASYLETLVNQQRKNIPGLSDELPLARDLFGEPITRESGLGWAWDLVSPIASRVDDPDPVTQAILDNQVQISTLPRQINGVKLSAQEYSDFAEEAGKPLKEYLDRMVASPGFKRMSDGPDGMKAELIRDAVNTFRDRARIVMMQKNPHLRELSFIQQQNRMRTLQGAN